MENEVENKKDKDKVIKRQRIAIIVLSIVAVLFMGNFINAVIITKLEKRPEITFTANYNQSTSVYYCCELEVLCKEDTLFNVGDFTFLRDGGNICVSKITVDGKTYESGKSFAINKYEKTKVVLYMILLKENEVSTIYYKSKPIEYGHTRKV